MTIIPSIHQHATSKLDNGAGTDTYVEAGAGWRWVLFQRPCTALLLPERRNTSATVAVWDELQKVAVAAQHWVKIVFQEEQLAEHTPSDKNDADMYKCSRNKENARRGNGREEKPSERGKQRLRLQATIT